MLTWVIDIWQATTNYVKPLLIPVNDKLTCFSNFTGIHRTLYQAERKQSQRPAAEAGTTHVAASAR